MSANFLFNAFVPTLELLFLWSLLALLVAGIGYVVRTLLWRSPIDRSPAMTDLWLGVVALIAYLQVWNIFFAISLLSWVPPLVVGLAGLALCLRGGYMASTVRREFYVPTAVCIVLAVAWIANLALGPEGNYDDGLYHVGLVHYAMNYGTIPGLAHLEVFLGFSDPSLLFVAFLARPFSLSGGIHLANGFLAALLFLEVGRRFVLRGQLSAAPFTRRLALLLGVATIVVIAKNPAWRVSSADLDLPTYVFMAVGMLYLAETVEVVPTPTPAAAASLGLLTLAAVMRPLFWGAVVAAVIVLVLTNRYRKGAQRFLRPALAVLPLVLIAGWAVRQALLTGYPFFPLTVGGLPVSWKIPASVVASYLRVTYAWSREPRIPPDQVLSSWHWLTAWWLPRRSRDADVMAPLVLLSAALVLLALWPRAFMRGARQEARGRETAAMAAVFVPSALLVVGWFLTAPDPRFALAPIWLCPLAIAAWVWTRPVWSGMRNPVVKVVALASIPAVLAITVLDTSTGAFKPIETDGPQAVFGLPLNKPSVARFTTASGLKLLQTAGGTDQCWNAIFCTAYPDPNVVLRSRGLAGGFREGP